jgi:hypothetical protein
MTGIRNAINKLNPEYLKASKTCIGFYNSLYKYNSGRTGYPVGLILVGVDTATRELQPITRLRLKEDTIATETNFILSTSHL